jgi:hypothetical protein
MPMVPGSGGLAGTEGILSSLALHVWVLWEGYPTGSALDGWEMELFHACMRASALAAPTGLFNTDN